MKRYIPLYEFAKPLKRHKSKTYYHGTSKEKNGISITKNGIKPPDLTNTSGRMTPVEGKTYMTSDLKYAIVYALGGGFIGHEMPAKTLKNDRYGY